MDKSDDSGSPGQDASFLTQTTGDIAKAVATVASAVAIHSPWPSVAFSSRDEYSSQLPEMNIGSFTFTLSEEERL